MSELNDVKKEIVNQETIVIPQKKKRGNPKWQKGMKSPNPMGPGVNTVKLAALFSEAFHKDMDKHNGRSLFELAFERAHTDKAVLIALLNKFVPDLLKGEGFASTDITNIFSGEQIAATERRELIEALRARRGESQPA